MVSTAIILCSAAMLAYWFRYTCSLLIEQQLQAREPTAACGRMAAGCLSRKELHSILLSLDADYRMLSYLLAQVPTTFPPPARRLLAIHYRLLRLWCGVLGKVAPKHAQRTAAEMALVVACLGRALEPARG